MGTYRKRFNEKARAGHMARIKELKRIRNKQFYRQAEEEENNEIDGKAEPTNTARDSNAEILEPLTEEEKKQKKRKLEELFTPKESKVSRQKKKRLEKFIEHQIKREEKKAIIQKLQDYKIDTSLLTSSKKLGQGRQTKKEAFAEALSLENQGRSSEQTKEILYEEHAVKEWNGTDQNLNENDVDSFSDDDDEDDDFESKFGDTSSTPKSSFIDNRPAKFGGSGIGFGFANVKVVNKDKKPPKKKYNWRQKVELQEKHAINEEDDQDFISSSEAEESEDESESDAFDDDAEVASEIEGSEVAGDSQDSEVENVEESGERDDGMLSSEEELTEKPKKFSHSKEAEDFKSWANQEIKKMEGRDIDTSTPKLNIPYTPIIREEDLEDGLTQDSVPIDETSTRKAFFVQVNRPDDIQKVRMQLPVFNEEHNIMEAIYHNDVVIICGQTGSGKTTQVPQFLYESGFGNTDSPDYPGMVGITQPRRVATVSMANRVANELGDHGDKVAYQIRFDSTTKDNTKIKFMTDGVLLREMMNDFKLTKYSSIIIDEAHERNINTDILIGMLSRCVRLRAKEHANDPKNSKRLKLIIMSATLRVSDFSENGVLFPTPPPILNVDARQFPVSVHFNRKTPFNYADEAFRKACKIHRRLPPGTILIFMTGQQEINHMVKKLRKEFPLKNKISKQHHISEVKINPKNADLEAEEIDISVQALDEEKFKESLAVNEENGSDDSDNEEGFEETLTEGQTANDPLYVLPLYSLLPTKEQMKVFEQPPTGSRLCIVATNVAETSLTIPGVRYVVDCGRSKERQFNEENGVQSFEIGWISKASADQRSGRAGRTGPGHCYRLYSSAVYERDFDQFSRPEILRMPVESIVLQMKSMAIHNIVNFPFPTSPDRSSLSKAIELLQYLGALDVREKITEDGKKMSLFPLPPRFSKMLLVSNEQNCLPYVVSIVSGLSVGDPFISEYELGINEKKPVKKTDDEDSGTREEEQGDGLDIERVRALRAKFYKSRSKFQKLDKCGDVFRLLSVISAFDYIPKSQRENFIRDNFLRGKIMEEISKLRKQLTYIIKSNLSKENIAVTVKDEDLKTKIPDEVQVKLLKQMVCAGFIDHVAIRADQLFPEEATITNRTSMINVPYIPIMAQRKPQIEECFVYIHPTSVLNNLGEMPPRFLVYHSLNLGGNEKTRMSALCDIKSTPLANIARKGALLTYSKPLTGQGLKSINISVSERYCYVVPRFGASVDSDLKIGWDLNPIPVHQNKEKGQWLVDRFITNKNYKAAELKQKK
ncbi:hypothetical protein KAFR_0D02780 [Kazachstania africana CBS 2517]|uniref:RNA helicase n=1 Tax=Kazachstania africana (strain ATCC 22294 / BCRC 22015 / CBS 2517 / CECT 1963 / NBRC 1671 / NRRL Y-8276) TaxID=1071382 RepID=H2AU76_KAZAF|nr:hypothetical protein KAFR_0D02780 [Kazachstania africana CBS 2517]CCF57926.1 hypothetical protein KAFR_0D02780 [Kazachstania africana CBS 2517]